MINKNRPTDKQSTFGKIELPQLPQLIKMVYFSAAKYYFSLTESSMYYEGLVNSILKFQALNLYGDFLL